MTPKQQVILDFIRDYPQQYPPTVREIAAGVGLSSSSTVHYHLTELVKLGLVERKPNCPRCITLK
jgi:repressor LexA